MDFAQLTADQFVLLCVRILSARGYAIQRHEPRARDIGVDFSLTSESGAIWIAEVKHIPNHRTSTSFIRRAAHELNSAKSFLSAYGAILIVSMTLPSRLRSELSQRHDLLVWDGSNIRTFLNHHSEVEHEFITLIEAQTRIERGVGEADVLDNRAIELISRLESCNLGREEWHEYELICIEILNYAFIPPFRIPKVQSRSEDGLDIRDAVYPISNGHQFWDVQKRECNTRFVVAEFKNYSEQPDQKVVESIQQYLYKKAMRTFGFLCTRLEPKESALKARRRAWVEFDKLIILLTDEDLKDIVRTKSFGNDPSEIIDTQLDDFFLDLSP